MVLTVSAAKSVTIVHRPVSTFHSSNADEPRRPIQTEDESVVSVIV